MMEHKDIEAEIKKKCKKCGFSDLPHCVYHRPQKTMYIYRRDPVYIKEAMVFVCTRCGYTWEIEVTQHQGAGALPAATTGGG